MPSAKAQGDLIRSTYAKAGLDLRNPSNHPNYFEAHGTGTPAGDPIEAEAISTAFFGKWLANGHNYDRKDHPLYVGSIKTVLGHTEGSAGIAAILKTSLALQNSTIPPNSGLGIERDLDSLAEIFSIETPRFSVEILLRSLDLAMNLCTPISISMCQQDFSARSRSRESRN
ncbi:thiolase-like protein [Nemania serpens]|nr:thiolase-like protein [Nemania serpens]